MPNMPHRERHFTASETVRDVVIGMADGLTVPFALAAGLAAAVSSTAIVVTAGLAEIAAGAIAMGLGGYLAARTDQQHYISEYQRELRETHDMPEEELREVAAIFAGHGLSGNQLDAAVRAIASDRNRWVDFMMRFELGLEKPDPNRAPISAATIGGSYLVGGLIPLMPYMVEADLTTAFRWSVAVTGAALLVFGAVKGHLTGTGWVKSAYQTTLVGGHAAAAAYVIAGLFA
jgi:VIT1/CCC1 family predicted Fe2+/Mn2+ transporter